MKYNLTEEWRPIVGYESYYEVSNLGRIRRIHKARGTKCGILKEGTTKSGYSIVVLSIKGKTNSKFVHRLVAEAFLENPNHLPEVNHKDENPKNNEISNLEWVSSKENNNWGNHIKRVSLSNTNNPKCSKPIIRIKDGISKKFPSIKEAARWCRNNGFPKAASSSISNCCSGKVRSAYGAEWKFAEK